MSERGFGSSIAAALDGDVVSLSVLCYVDWPGGAGYFWSGVGTLNYDGHDWTGVGDLVEIDKVADSLDKSDIGVQLTLNYLNDDIRNEVVTNDPLGRDAALILALIDPTDRSVTETYEFFPAFVDEIEIVDSGDTGQLKVRLASELSRLRKSRWFQLSDAHQQYLFPGDLGCEFAPNMDEPVLWGRKALQPRTGAASGTRSQWRGVRNE